jgi:endonuclease YncB( thermonuclease family)
MNVKKAAIGSGLAMLGISAAAASILLSQTSYTVTRIIDGDTFETKEKQIIRIKDIDAPENGYCGYDTSKTYLEHLILGKNVYIKVTWLDRFRRQTGYVYLSDGTNLSEKIVRDGQAILVQTSKSDAALLAAGNEARTKKRGLYGQPCTQETNPEHPSCTIKGNRRYNTNEKIYHYPGCPQYNNVIMQRYEGDEWFCTTAAAQKAGYVKATDCP